MFAPHGRALSNRTGGNVVLQPNTIFDGKYSQGRGWRKAVRYTLTENPIADSVIRRRSSDFELTLFSELE
jgi:hypothetical protein